MENKTKKMISIAIIIVILCSIFLIIAINKSDNKRCVCEAYSFAGLFPTQEYFMVENKDTSAYSFIFTEINSNALLEIDYSPFYKQFLENNISKDTTLLANIKEETIVRYYSLDYSGLLKEFDKCLFTYSQKNDISRLKSICFRLCDFEEIAIKATNAFLLVKNNQIPKHKDIDEALKKTTLTQDLNNLLIKYNLNVKSIHSQEEIFLIDRFTFMNVSLIHPEIKVPPYIIDVEILVKIDQCMSRND